MAMELERVTRMMIAVGMQDARLEFALQVTYIIHAIKEEISFIMTLMIVPTMRKEGIKMGQIKIWTARVAGMAIEGSPFL
jgi:hypothetical protein